MKTIYIKCEEKKRIKFIQKIQEKNKLRYLVNTKILQV